MIILKIIVWFALVSLIIVISYLLRRKRKSEEILRQKKLKQRALERMDIDNRLSEYDTRYRKVQIALSAFGEDIICDRAEDILREMYNKSYVGKHAYEVFAKSNAFIKEITVLENLLDQYQKKKIAKKQKTDEFNDLKFNLQSKIRICENLELSEEQRKILSSVKNRFNVDLEKVKTDPQSALKRTQSSLKRLEQITA